MARPKVNASKTTIGIREGLAGWIEYRGREYSGGMSAYLNDLAAADRADTLAEGGQDAERYRAWLVATGNDAELGALDAEGGL